MRLIYPHHEQFDGPWTWPNFSARELACSHCGEYFHDPASLDALQRLRDAWGKPITINSAHRCVFHNRSVGGVANSQHVKIAFDCRCARHDQAAFARMAAEAGFTGIGVYPGKGFVHVDMGPRRKWTG